MTPRVNIRCVTCGWYTSRAPKADQDYGLCRCGAVLAAVRSGRYRRRGPYRPRGIDRRRDLQPGATWPELVAAELDRQERG